MALTFKEQKPIAWLRACSRDPSSPARVTRGDLAALTGTDTRVLNAVAECWRVYAYSRPDYAALRAAAALLPLMQKHTRPLARELIAWAMDWSDRDRVWAMVTAGGVEDA